PVHKAIEASVLAPPPNRFQAEAHPSRLVLNVVAWQARGACPPSRNKDRLSFRLQRTGRLRRQAIADKVFLDHQRSVKELTHHSRSAPLKSGPSDTDLTPLRGRRGTETRTS